MQNAFEGGMCAERQAELAYPLIENRYLFIFSIAGDAFHEHEHGELIEVAIPPQFGMLIKWMIGDI